MDFFSKIAFPFAILPFIGPGGRNLQIIPCGFLRLKVTEKDERLEMNMRTLGYEDAQTLLKKRHNLNLANFFYSFWSFS